MLLLQKKCSNMKFKAEPFNIKYGICDLLNICRLWGHVRYSSLLAAIYSLSFAHSKGFKVRYLTFCFISFKIYLSQWKYFKQYNQDIIKLNLVTDQHYLLSMLEESTGINATHSEHTLISSASADVRVRRWLFRWEPDCSCKNLTVGCHTLSLPQFVPDTVINNTKHLKL